MNGQKWGKSTVAKMDSPSKLDGPVESGRSLRFSDSQQYCLQFNHERSSADLILCECLF